MSNKDKQEPQETVENILLPQPMVLTPEQYHKIQLVNIRQECIKLSYSAGKRVDEILSDAAILTDWVLTGKIKSLGE